MGRYDLHIDALKALKVPYIVMIIMLVLISIILTFHAPLVLIIPLIIIYWIIIDWIDTNRLISVLQSGDEAAILQFCRRTRAFKLKPTKIK